MESQRKVVYPREMIFIPGVDSYSDTDKKNHLDLVKKSIMKYGSLGSFVYFDSEFLSDDQKSYYCGKFSISPANHAVSIIGWNDNYSKENFKIKPEHDGALIVKNSWGTDIHDKGYFYLSYDDAFANVEMFAVTEVDETQEKYLFDNIYQKDYLGMQWVYPTTQKEIIECKTFDLKTKEENLTDIGFYTADSDVKCEFYLVKLDSDGKPIGLYENMKLGEKSYEFPGYHTFEVTNNIILKANEVLDSQDLSLAEIASGSSDTITLEDKLEDNQGYYDVTKSNGKFGIAIKMKLKNAKNGNTIGVPIEIKNEELFGTSKACGQEGENFIIKVNKDGKVTSCRDIYENIETPWFSFDITNLNIKAFTEKL